MTFTPFINPFKNLSLPDYKEFPFLTTGHQSLLNHCLQPVSAIDLRTRLFAIFQGITRTSAEITITEKEMGIFYVVLIWESKLALQTTYFPFFSQALTILVQMDTWRSTPTGLAWFHHYLGQITIPEFNSPDRHDDLFATPAPSPQALKAIQHSITTLQHKLLAAIQESGITLTA